MEPSLKTSHKPSGVFFGVFIAYAGSPTLRGAEILAGPLLLEQSERSRRPKRPPKRGRRPRA
jgi:hypothetical protein